MRVSLLLVLFVISGVGPRLSAQDVPAVLATSASGDAVAVGEGPQRDPPGTNGAVIYEREVFQYSAGGRPDPFRSLLLEDELGVRPEDLALRGVLIDPVAARSVAVLSQVGSSRRIQLRTGERIGAIRLLSIQPDRVEIVVEELGVSRRETLRLVRPQQGATP